jgi:hypothetical protein
MELEHGHDRPHRRDLTDREADWQQYGKAAVEQDDGRPF